MVRLRFFPIFFPLFYQAWKYRYTKSVAPRLFSERLTVEVVGFFIDICSDITGLLL